MNIPKLVPGTPIRVKWDDAGNGADQHWLKPSEIKDIQSVTTLGYFMTRTNRYFTIAQTTSKSTDGTVEYGSAFSVPVGCIRKITKL